jgi:hypothetical protein
VARKGDLQAVRHLNLGMDAALADALLASAVRNERRLAEECRFAVRLYLGLVDQPRTAHAEVSTDAVPA